MSKISQQSTQGVCGHTFQLSHFHKTLSPGRQFTYLYLVYVSVSEYIQRLYIAIARTFTFKFQMTHFSMHMDKRGELVV